MAETYIVGSEKLPVQITGSSVIKDNEQNDVIRMVDAAPYIAEIAEYKTPTHTSINVTTTTSVVLAANTLRKYTIIVNNSDDPIYLAFGNSAQVNLGICLPTKYSSYEMSAMQGNLYKGAIQAIHGGTGTKQILITEGA